MSRKIYYYLIAVSTTTAAITSIVLVFLFYDFFNSKGVEEFNNLNTLFLSIILPMAGILVFILVFLYFFASVLTSKIIRPIELASQNIESILSGNNVIEEDIYEELIPFIKTIDLQKMEIEYSIHKLKELENIRRDFTANVSHELKTPLTSINGFAEMLSNGMATEDDTKIFGKKIHKEGTRLLGLIDSIISLSKLEEIPKDKEFVDIDIYNLATDIITELHYRAIAKSIKLNITGESTIIRGNIRMIHDMILNLVDNGIKYNKNEGSVDIFVKEISDYCILKVSDTGIGIPKDEQNRVFERFYMVDKSRSKKVGGYGLGLSIVKHIVDYHGGRIFLSSQEDKGTEFTIRIPLKKSLLQ